jgi:glycosyltransferase involved in cell wall biosynthesis
MTTIAFIVNGDPASAMGRRASAFQKRLGERYDIRLAYRTRRKNLSLLRFIIFLMRARPKLCYVFDMSYSGVVSGLLYKSISRACLVIDTGDAIYDLARSTGNRGAMGLLLTRWLENISLRMADRVVVRGTFHQTLLSNRGVDAELIQDGVESEIFTPFKVDELRKRYGLDGVLTVGILGASVWSEKLQMCYGWELIETLRLLKDAPIKGIIIGDGSGIAHLKAWCVQSGIEDRVVFFGHVPYEDLPAYINLMDVCLSTQTNDVVGRVRTTGKLPLYMASGRYILASQVGEAVLALDSEMLVEYEGVKDSSYPHRLADRIAELLANPEKLTRGLKNVRVARLKFDYSVLAERVANLIESLLKNQEAPEEAPAGKAVDLPRLHE